MKEKTAVFSRSCVPWTLNLRRQVLVWSQPTPECMDMPWNSLLKWVFNEVEVWESIFRPYDPQRVVGSWSFIKGQVCFLAYPGQALEPSLPPTAVVHPDTTDHTRSE